MAGENEERPAIKHPIRRLIAKLPFGLDRLAWLGLIQPKRDGWGAEK